MRSATAPTFAAQERFNATSGFDGAVRPFSASATMSPRQPQEAVDAATDAAIAAAIVRERRQRRLLRFALCEAAAILLTVASMLAGMSTRFLDESLTPLFRMLPIVGAAAATILPILFYGRPTGRVSRTRLRI
jgi:hypothetical protein